MGEGRDRGRSFQPHWFVGEGRGRGRSFQPHWFVGEGRGRGHFSLIGLWGKVGTGVISASLVCEGM